jgi:hypothetical protein
MAATSAAAGGAAEPRGMSTSEDGAPGSARARAGRRLRTAGAVLAIVTASMIGLHDWADGATTHGIPSSGASSHDSSTS